MKKILIMILVLTRFFTFAQDGFPDEECKKAFDSFRTAFFKKDWNGFDGKGGKIPSTKLIYKGVVNFPYYDSNEGKKKYLKEIVEIYKYEPALNVSFIIPTEKLDFSSSPELACLSYGTIDISDYRNRTPEDWEELKEIVKEKRKRSLWMHYKMCLKTDDGEVVAILTSNNYPFIMFEPKDSNKWEFIHSISFQENVLFYVIHHNLYLEELPGTHEEKMKSKLKAIMEDKLTLSPDIEDDIAKDPKLTKHTRVLTIEEMERKFQEDIKRAKEEGLILHETIIDVGDPKKEKQEN